MSRPKYEMVSYQPPTAQVFGNASFPSSLPKVSAPSINVPRAPRVKLKDRLAIYENDDPACQRILCLAGFFLPAAVVCRCMFVLQNFGDEGFDSRCRIQKRSDVRGPRYRLGHFWALPLYQ